MALREGLWVPVRAIRAAVLLCTFTVAGRDRRRRARLLRRRATPPGQGSGSARLRQPQGPRAPRDGMRTRRTTTTHTRTHTCVQATARTHARSRTRALCALAPYTGVWLPELRLWDVRGRGAHRKLEPVQEVLRRPGPAQQATVQPVMYVALRRRHTCRRRQGFACARWAPSDRMAVVDRGSV